MRRILIAIAVVAVLFVAMGGGTWWASKQVPDFYESAIAEEMPAPERKQAAKEFVQQTLRIVEDVQFSDRWAEEFHQDQINSWLAEELQTNYPELVPKGVTDPRVGLHDGMLSLGFKFDSEAWGGIVSVRVKPWIVESNRLAVEIVSIRAGLVPIPLDELLREVASEVETEGLPVQWIQRNGHDVAIVTIDSGPDGPVLEQLEVVEGIVRVSGSGAAKPTPGQSGLLQVSLFPTR